MKKLLIMLAILFSFSASYAEDCLLAVGLTHDFQMQLFQQHRYEELANFESNFAPEDIPINSKIKEFNNILNNREFEIVSGDMIHDYVVVVKLINCNK